jgi:hypothetical protein
MKTAVINHPLPCVASLGLLFAIQLRAAQFVELTAEIETVDWHNEAVSRQPPWTVRCVVGTNAWRIDGKFYLAHYRPAMVPDSQRFGTNGWELQLTARAR